jgi:hypothetical protein
MNPFMTRIIVNGEVIFSKKLTKEQLQWIIALTKDIEQGAI